MDTREAACPLSTRGYSGGWHLLACDFVGGWVHDGTAFGGLGPRVKDRTVDLLEMHGLFAKFVMSVSRGKHTGRLCGAHYVCLVYVRVFVVFSCVLSNRNSLDLVVIVKRLLSRGLCAVDAHVRHKRYAVVLLDGRAKSLLEGTDLFLFC